MVFNEALNKMVDGLKAMMTEMIAKADYDKTYIGIITSVDTEKMPYRYSVSINGAERAVKSSSVLSVGSYATVLVPRNNWDNAIIINANTLRYEWDAESGVLRFYTEE